MDNNQSKLPYFKIAGQAYSILEKKTKWVVVELSKTLYTEIQIQSQDIASDKEKGLVDDYFNDGIISVNFEASGIYKNGVPTAICNYDEDKDPEDYSYFRKEGLDYSLYSYGTIEFTEGWVI